VKRGLCGREGEGMAGLYHYDIKGVLGIERERALYYMYVWVWAAILAC
jgi:hypothetical protein